MSAAPYFLYCFHIFQRKMVRAYIGRQLDFLDSICFDDLFCVLKEEKKSVFLVFAIKPIVHNGRVGRGNISGSG